MKIGARLTVGFGIVVALLAIMFGLSLYRLGSLNHEIDDLIKDKIVKADTLNDINEQVNVIARASRNARLAVDKAAAIRKYKTKNPTATQKDIALALGMSRDTVRKYTAG